jgi:putative spermidine/putrescine transport system permease protein
MLFLYGPMLVIYLLSFQGPDGGVTFPMRGFSTVWFGGILESEKIGDIPSAFWRSIALASVVSPLTVIISVAAGLGFRRRFPGAGVLFYLAIASLVMPSLLVGFGIALSFHFLGIETGLFTSALAAQMTWTLPHGLLTMFAVIGRFNRSWEEAAADLGASAWQRIRFVVLPILLPGIIGVAMGGFTLSYDEYARTTLTAGSHNTLPMEIFALTTNNTSPTLFAIGTVTTIVSFAVIAFTLWTILRIRRRRGTMLRVAG